MSKYDGKTELEIDGQKLTLCFTWGVLAEIHSKYGFDVFANLFQENPKTIADIIGIASGSDGAILLNSTSPIAPIIAQIQVALKHAYFGNDDVDSKKKPSKASK